MNSGQLRRGLHIDDDDAPEKYQYGGFDADRKKGNTEKDLDAMLFGGARPRRRRNLQEKKQQPVNNPAQDKAKVEPPKPALNVSQSVSSSRPANVNQPGSSTYKQTTSIELSRSTTVTHVTQATQQKQDLNRSGAITGNKDPSILKPSEPSNAHKESSGGTIGIISKPKIDNYVQEKKTGNNQPEQQVEEDIGVDVHIHGFGNKNMHNKPGYLRKGKKVAEDFKFAEENVTLHSAVDVVRPLQTNRSRQRKLNDYNFHDYEFPANSVCISPLCKDSAWKKPNEVARVVNFGKYIDPNDFCAGSYSSPQFLSALSGIAELEANTKRLIEDQSANSNGFYLIRLFINSVWRYIAVDNSIPFVNGQNAGVISYEGDFDLQGALIEKAYAKSFGGYDSFDRIQPRECYLRDLTGAPVRKYGLEHPGLKDIVCKALSSGQVVQAVPTERIASLGINPNFSYSVINYANKGLELRNSWGTIDERAKISIKGDGNFELTSGQLRDNISHILVSNIHPEYSTTTIQAKHRLGFYSSHSFKVRNNTHGFLTVSQWDERHFPLTCGYEYSPASIVLQKDNEDKSADFINANHTVNGRNLDLEVNLEPGNYTVFVAINWKGADQSFNLTFYGSERVDFSRIHTDKEPNLISQSLENYNVDNGRKSDSKGSVQYFSYQRESNLFLITLENSGSRQTKLNIDLSRAKLDKVTLISGHNNEDNYSEKVSYQIDDYKQTPLSDRRWAVYLEGGQRFTWVLSSKQAYNEGNARAWGLI